MKLQDKTIWLIGASSGIGAALAEKLVAQGARLAISARREEELQKVAAACAPSDVLVKPLDVTRSHEIRAVHSALVQELGHIDIVIFSAGTWTFSSVKDFDADTAIQQADVNYLGLMRTVGEAMPPMILRGSGGIVGIASIAGYAGLPRAAAYSSSKAGVHAFLQSIRMELKRYNVDVITVSPGFVETPLTERNDFPMPFMISAGEAAETIVAGLLKGHEEIHFPLRLSIPVKLFTALPRPLYEFLARMLMAR